VRGCGSLLIGVAMIVVGLAALFILSFA